MLKAMKTKLKEAGAGQNAHFLGLQKELAELELATGCLYEAVEKRGGAHGRHASGACLEAQGKAGIDFD